MNKVMVIRTKLTSEKTYSESLLNSRAPILYRGVLNVNRESHLMKDTVH